MTSSPAALRHCSAIGGLVHLQLPVSQSAICSVPLVLRGIAVSSSLGT
ncbi:hypothetical protein [Actinoplanes subglobosus]|uniref:Uncharacterized protein n=1 Tax=Actinoplanes subglobosus TaxID=1547892 RepID=A0ABV8JDS8_9ACTN